MLAHQLNRWKRARHRSALRARVAHAPVHEHARAGYADIFRSLRDPSRTFSTCASHPAVDCRRCLPAACRWMGSSAAMPVRPRGVPPGTPQGTTSIREHGGARAVAFAGLRGELQGQTCMPSWRRGARCSRQRVGGPTAGRISQKERSGPALARVVASGARAKTSRAWTERNGRDPAGPSTTSHVGQLQY